MSLIIYIGDNNYFSTSYHRAKALERIGYKVIMWNPYLVIKKGALSNLINTWNYKTGYFFIQHEMQQWLDEQIELLGNIKPDLIWVNGGELLGVECCKKIKQFKCPLILYNNDDPTGGRDGNRFSTLLKAIPYYDLCVVMREINILEFKNAGAKNVLKVMMSYDEIFHQPFSDLELIPTEYRSKVVFIGTLLPKEGRDEFVLKLIEQNVPVSIWGNGWNKSKYFSRLKSFWKGNSIYGRDYIAAIQGAKICLGFLSKGNRDLHTTRSVEIPYAGGLLCAERTTEHLMMYEENHEAVFWNTPDECADVCMELLNDESKIKSIKEAGRDKVKKLSLGNEDVCKKILSHI